MKEIASDGEEFAAAFLTPPLPNGIPGNAFL
jgi:hypothetical protein